jgi:hypothetical protein
MATDRKPAEKMTTADEKSTKTEIPWLAVPIDLETIRKIKELCQRYGAETVKQMVNDAA